ncbi:cell division protein FtsL [Paenibacillus lutrae]|uniref:Cell division protein FtsL n=1 Tax=Paenibacillus lutrae TaxID=2078573 RepID=A0A7X3FGM8_9BACL|nr:cell division protein FtsL [Paenibacillus lutrae]MVO99374.1 cell division protein FtsL [Paenibacillus lutrae]
MSRYIQGNLAEKSTSSTQRVTVRETKKVIVKNKQLPVGEKLLYLMLVLICVLIASGIVGRYTSIYQLNSSIKETKTEIAKVQADNDASKQEIEKLKDPERLEALAKQKGLKPADDAQVRQVVPGTGQTAGGKDNSVATGR